MSPLTDMFNASMMPWVVSRFTGCLGNVMIISLSAQVLFASVAIAQVIPDNSLGAEATVVNR